MKGGFSLKERVRRAFLRIRRSMVASLAVCLLLAASPLSAHGETSAACTKAKPFRVAVDIGHSKRRFGATSATGRREYDFNRRLALELIEEARFDPHLDLFAINISGGKISLRERPRRARRRNAQAFISIHHDSVNERYIKHWSLDGKRRKYSDRFRGHSIFVSRSNRRFRESLSLARDIGRALKADQFTPTLHHAEPIKGENRELLDRRLGIYNAPFAVLVHGQIPAILLEAGVIIHRQEERDLDKAAFRMRIVSAVLAGIRQFCSE